MGPAVPAMLDLIPFALQVTALILLLVGSGFAYRKKYSWHSWVMVAAVAIHTASILWHMIPSLIENSALLGQTTSAGIVIWSHVILGTVAEILGIASILWWALRRDSHTSPPSQPKRKWTMRVIFAIWAAALILGMILSSLYV